MVAKSAEQCPTSCFPANNHSRENRPSAAVRRAGVLDRCPGTELGHWDFPPHVLNLRLPAKLAAWSSLGPVQTHHATISDRYSMPTNPQLLWP
ncbi:hypothetical protein BDW75DRAFT_206622 [Aspergillus navahoensis]